jgi:DNA-binding protein HU-beta
LTFELGLVYAFKLDMTKKDLVDQVCRKAHLTKKAATEAVEVFLDEVGRILSKGEKVVLSGFGTFRVISMKGKTVKIPNTDKMVTIKAHRSPRFTPGKKLKRQVAR